jgi:hypothetical protein
MVSFLHDRGHNVPLLSRYRYSPNRWVLTLSWIVRLLRTFLRRTPRHLRLRFLWRTFTRLGWIILRIQNWCHTVSEGSVYRGLVI